VYRIKAYWDVKEYRHPSLTSPLDIDEWSTPRLGRFTLEVEAASMNGGGGWLDP